MNILRVDFDYLRAEIGSLRKDYLVSQDNVYAIMSFDTLKIISRESVKYLNDISVYNLYDNENKTLFGAKIFIDNDLDIGEVKIYG